MNTKIFTVLGVLAVAGLAAAYFATRSSTPATPDTPSTTPANSLLFPDLASKADSIAQITVKRAPMEFTIKKDGDAWKVADKANYPAKLDTVRALIVGLTQLRLSEEKTSRPDQYAKLGVDDPIAPPAASADKPVPQSALVTLKDAAGNPLASAILGNPKYSGAGVGGSATPQMYVRKAGDKTTWLASGQVELPREPLGWLESRFADIHRDRIKSVVITHPDNSVVTVSRDKQADPFAVRDIPAGRELKDPGVGESIASTLTGLAFQDVAAAASLIPPPPPADSNTPPSTDIKPGPTIIVRTFDGLIVTVKSVSKDARAWWTLNATIDESLAAPPPPPPEAKPSEPAPPAPAAPAVGTLEALKKESSELNTSWSPYAFAPADWKVRNINSLLSDLLKEPPKPGDAASSSLSLPPGLQQMPAAPTAPAPRVP